ncbi:hypothetical protein RRF57_006718 [Xylaria bambusicola]|uniref:Uncharacterized protein n=1 Tax=Xylaria bambusicola TaxID=326684 RepID=A0AAN7UJR5_9PEZI
MARHTADFLRQRSSNISLRMAASSPLATSRLSSFANPAEFEAKPTMTEAEKAVIVGELKTRRDVKLCDSCYRDLPDSCANLLSLELTNNRNSCSTCAIKDTKPEAFTEPFCTFLRENPTIFHTVDYLKTKMTSLGYKEVSVTV